MDKQSRNKPRFLGSDVPKFDKKRM